MAVQEWEWKKIELKINIYVKPHRNHLGFLFVAMHLVMLQISHELYIGRQSRFHTQRNSVWEREWGGRSLMLIKDCASRALCTMGKALNNDVHFNGWNILWDNEMHCLGKWVAIKLCAYVYVWRCVCERKATAATLNAKNPLEETQHELQKSTVFP